MKSTRTRTSLRTIGLSALLSLLWLSGCGDQVIVEECKTAPQESFWQKAEAEYKKMF